MIDGGSRKGEAKWKIIPETGFQRDSVVCSKNYIVRYRENWRCLDSAGKPSPVWYRMPMWIKLETEHPIISSRLDLAQSREGCRLHDRLSTPMY